MKKNGYSGIEMLIVIVVLGVITLVVLTSTSNSFKDDSKAAYDEKIYLIEHQAALYGETLASLKDEEYMIITLDDVLNAGYYVADNDNGKVIDPRNTKATLNGINIKLTYNNGDIKAAVIE